MCDPQEVSGSPSRTMSGSAPSHAGGPATRGPLGRLRIASSRKRTMSPPPADKENVKEGHVLPALSRLSWILPEDDHHCDSPVGRFPCSGWCRNPDGHSTMHDQDEDEVKADVISLASCKDSQLSWDDEKGQSMTSVCLRVSLGYVYR